MAEDPWYKRVVSPLRTTWERVKSVGREFYEVDPNDSWRHQARIEKRSIMRDNRSGKDDPQTTKQRLHEIKERRRAAWRAFRPDEPEPEIRLSVLERWMNRALDRQIQPQRLWAAWTTSNKSDATETSGSTTDGLVAPDHRPSEETERTPPEDGPLPLKPVYGPRYLAAKAAYLEEVRERQKDSVSLPPPSA